MVYGNYLNAKKSFNFIIMYIGATRGGGLSPLNIFIVFLICGPDSGLCCVSNFSTPKI